MPKKKKQKRSLAKHSSIRRLAYWKVELQKARNKYAVLYEIKSNLSTRMTEEIALWLQSNPALSRCLFGTAFPKNNKEWKSTPVAANASFDREVLWCCLNLLPYASDIAKFVELSEVYKSLFVRGEYEDCLALLDSVEKSL